MGQIDLSAGSIFSTGFWIQLWHAIRTSVLGALGEILLVIVIFLAIRLVLYKLIDRLIISVTSIQTIEAQGNRVARIKTLQGLIKSITGYLLFFVASLMILRAVHIDPLPLLTTASVAGLAVAFGAQKLVKDVISGFFIILENQYSVGDYVTISGVTGIVEDIGMRMTRLRDSVGKLVIISNGDITMVTNHCRGAITCSIDIAVAADSDAAKVTDTLNDVGRHIAEAREDVFTAFCCEGIASLDAGKLALHIEGKIDPRDQEDILLDLRTRIRNRFLEEQITLA